MPSARHFSRGRNYALLLGRIVAFVVVYLLLDAVANTLLALAPSLKVVQPVPPRVGLIREAVSLATVLGATSIMALIEARPPRDYGYGPDRAFRRVGAGLASGLAALSGLIACLYLAGGIRFVGVNPSLAEAARDAVLWAAVFLMIGLLEESIFRGYLQHSLSRGIGFWFAAIAVSGAFMVWHLQNDGETLLGLVGTGLGSFAFCLSLWYTRSLWWAIGFHTGWDWGQSFLFGTPDSGMVTQGSLFRTEPIGASYLSGGAVGPEGSTLLIPCFAVLVVLMWFSWGRNSPLRRG